MSEPCKRCQRQGLAIFPVLYAAAPKEIATSLTAPSGHFGAGVIDRPLQESTYFLRTLEPGYLYLLYPNKVWKGYLIDAAGYPRYYPDLLIEDMPSTVPAASEVTACVKQTGKDHTGIEAICIDVASASKGPTYIAYSRHRWTKSVRAEHAKAPEKRMQKIEAVSGAPFKHAEVASAAALKQWVADFKPTAVSALNKNLPAERQLQDRSAKADGISKAMLAMSGALAKPGLIMALHDPIGLTATINSHRNALVERVHGIDDKTSQAERDDMMVVAVIENLRESITTSKGDWPRHEKHIDQAKYKPAKKLWEERAALASRVDARSKDYVAWMCSALTKTVFEADFDPTDARSGFALEDAFVACTQGSGVTQTERDKVWQPWFEAEADSKDNLIWRAATANDKDLLALMLTSKIDKTFKIEKSSFGAFKRTEWYKQLHAAHAVRLTQRRLYSETTEALVTILSGQLLWLQKRNPKLYMRSMAQLATVLVSRADILMLPEEMNAPLRSFTRWAQEAFLGKPKVQVPLTTSYAKGNTVRPRIIKPSDVPNSEVRQELKSLDGALMIDLSGKNPTVAFTAWVVSKLQPGKAMDPSLDEVFKRLKLNREAFVTPEKFAFNPLSGAERDFKTAKYFDRPLSVISSLFALLSFCKASNAITDELKKGKGADDEKILKGYVGLATAVTSGIASGLEIAAATKTIAANGVKSLLVRGLSFSAGVLSAVAGVVDAVMVWRSANRLSTDGDEDAAGAAYAAAFLGGVGSAFAGVGAGMIFFLSATGVGTVVVLAVGVVLIGISIYESIDSDQKTDTSLEKWLDRGRFGNHHRPDSKIGFKTLEAEMLALRTVLYAVNIQTQSLVQSATLRVFYTVALPFFSKDTEFVLRLFGTDPNGRERQLKQSTYHLASTRAIEVKDAHALPGDDVNQKIHGQQLVLEGEAMVRFPPLMLSRDPSSGKLSIPVGSTMRDVSDVPYFTQVRVAVSYKPDVQAWPTFELEASA